LKENFPSIRLRLQYHSRYGDAAISIAPQSTLGYDTVIRWRLQAETLHSQLRPNRCKLHWQPIGTRHRRIHLYHHWPPIRRTI